MREKENIVWCWNQIRSYFVEIFTLLRTNIDKMSIHDTFQTLFTFKTRHQHIHDEPFRVQESKNLIWLSLAFLLDFILLWWGQYSHVSHRWILLRSECNRTNCKFTITIQIFVRHAVVQSYRILYSVSCSS